MSESTYKITPMLLQYRKIRDKYPDGLLFYRMGDFYELFFDDAVIASNELDITLTTRGRAENGLDIPLCGVPVANYEIYLHRLIRKGYKVHICEQTENPLEAKKRGPKSVVNRAVVRTITLGTITEDNLLDGVNNNYLCSIYSDKKSLSVSWIDISTGEFWVQDGQIKDIVNILSRINPVEIIAPDTIADSLDFAEYKSTLSKVSIARFDKKNAKMFLEKSFDSNISSFGNFSDNSLIALGSLLDYVFLTQHGFIKNIAPPKQFFSKDFVSIDSNTFRNLEVFFGLSGGKDSLYNAINKTNTKQGARLLQHRLGSILKDKKEILERLESVEYLVNKPDLLSNLNVILKSAPDVERAFSRLIIGRGSIRDLLMIKNSFIVMDKIKNLFIKEVLPTELSNNLSKVSVYREMLHRLEIAIVPEPTLQIKDGGFIKTGFDANLDNVRGTKHDSESLIPSLRLEYASKTGVTQLKILHNNIIGYFIEIPSRFAAPLMSDSYFTHRGTTSTAVRFTTKRLSEIEDTLVSTNQKAIIIEQELFANIVKEVEEYASIIRDIAVFIAILDVAVSAANIALEYNMVKPEITVGDDFEIKDGFHIVVAKFLKQNNQDFISNDCNLSDSKISILTAPNMAGKSTFLRQNAIIVLLAQIGYFVPCSYAKIGIVDGIFSRIGAGDNLARGQSTFMVEMTETAYILNYATEKSLIILDELGRGTATFDGMAIAWSVLEHISTKVNARTLFATHYRELTDITKKYNNINCLTMKVIEENGKISFLHKVESGVSERSYGVHVALLAGLPSSVIKRANIVLKELETDNTLLDMPLFNLDNKEKNTYSEPILEELKSINIDDISPKQAHDILQNLINKAKSN